MADKYYVGQSYLRITVTTGVDITGATTLRIKYRKPDGTEGYWTATSSDDSNGVIYYDFTGDEFDIAGYWTVWAYVVFSDTRDADGEPKRFRVYSPGY